MLLSFPFSAAAVATTTDFPHNLLKLTQVDNYVLRIFHPPVLA